MNFATPFMIEPKFKCVWIRRRELSGIYRMPKFASKHFLRGGGMVNRSGVYLAQITVEKRRIHCCYF